jgi:uncharacterized membrane protein
MRSLGRLTPSQGIAAMQSINIAVINPVFMLVFLGTGLTCLILACSSFYTWNIRGAGYLLAGSLLYLLGTRMVTMVFNVPWNNRLAAVDPATENSAILWKAYMSSWTAWNHVRTAAALGAAVCLIIALCFRKSRMI